MKKIRFIPLAAIVLLMAFAYPVKDVKLEYTFKVGDKFQMSQVSKQNIKQDIPGMGEMKIDVSVEGSIDFKVIEVTATGAKIETSYSGLKMVTQSPMGGMSLDSQGAEDNVQNKVAKAMINKPFLVYMTKRGVIEKVENTDNLFSGLSELGLDAATLGQMKQSMQQTLGEGSIKGSLEMALTNYPETKVTEGGTWKNSTTMTAGFPMQIENTWKFTKLEGNVANIESDGTVTTPDKEKVSSLPNGMKTKSDLSGRQMTKSKVDIKTGWPVELKALSEIKGTMILLAGGPIPEDMSVPMEITSESTFTIVKK